jgi:hypothetical protein
MDLRFLLFSLVVFDLLGGDVTDMCLDVGMRPVYAYIMAPVKPSLGHAKLVLTGHDRPSLGFLDLDQPFLGTRPEERGQGLESRVFDIHRGIHSFCELKRTIWQDIRLIENRRRDWEGPGRQFRQCTGD